MDSIPTELIEYILQLVCGNCRDMSIISKVLYVCKQWYQLISLLAPYRRIMKLVKLQDEFGQFASCLEQKKMSIKSCNLLRSLMGLFNIIDTQYYSSEYGYIIKVKYEYDGKQYVLKMSDKKYGRKYIGILRDHNNRLYIKLMNHNIIFHKYAIDNISLDVVSIAKDIVSYMLHGNYIPLHNVNRCVCMYRK